MKEIITLITFFTILLLEDSFWFLMNLPIQNDDWRNPKLGCVPYFYFIISFLVLLLSVLSSNRYIYLFSIFNLIYILITYPFQVTCSSS
jgi:hypothetical protein